MKNPPLENYIEVFTNPDHLFMFIGISSGFILIKTLIQMILYEYEFYNGAGEDFLQFGKDTMMRNYYTRLILRITKNELIFPCSFNKWWFHRKTGYDKIVLNNITFPTINASKTAIDWFCEDA